MRTSVVTGDGRRSLRPRAHAPAGRPSRGELTAGLATAAVVGQLALAPAVLVLALALTLAGRLGRWRPRWLALPGAAGLAWLLAVGPRRSAAGFASGAIRLAGLIERAAVHPRALARGGALASAARWQYVGLPLAVLIGTAEAAALLWPYWHRPGIRWRPGLVAAMRGRLAAARLTAGGTVARDGCWLGWQAATGRLAGFSWAEAEHGVLLTGPDRRHLDELTFAAAGAGVRTRKALILIEAGGELELAAAVAGLARSLAVPVVADWSWPVAAIGRAIRAREVVVLPCGSPTAGRDASEAVRDLLQVLGGLRGLGLHADCLACVSGCDAVAPDLVADLVRIGPATGAAVLLATTSATTAAVLAPVARVRAVSHPVTEDANDARRLLARCVSPGVLGPVRAAGDGRIARGWFSLHVRDGRPELLPDCQSAGGWQ